MTACKAFVWIGQSMAHCDNCGRDIAEHEGLSWVGRGAKPFGTDDQIVLPFDEARQRIPLFAHFVTPIGHPEGPYRYQ